MPSRIKTLRMKIIIKMAEFLNVMSNALMVYWLPSSSGFPAFPHDNLPGWQHMRFRLFFTRWATIVHQLVHRNKFRFASHRPGESSNATRSPDWFNNICSLKENTSWQKSPLFHDPIYYGTTNDPRIFKVHFFSLVGKTRSFISSIIIPFNNNTTRAT